MASQKQINIDMLRRAFQQLYKGSETLLDMESTSWIDKVLLKRIHDQYGRKLEQIAESQVKDIEDGIIVNGDLVDGDIVQGDKIFIGGISGDGSVAIGSGVFAETTRRRDWRDVHYEIAKNWDGERSMCGFHLSETDLSGLSLENADLCKANLKGADLSKTNLVNANLSEADLRDANLMGADLSEVDLSGAKFSDGTIWPHDFNPREAGAILIDDNGEPVED